MVFLVATALHTLLNLQLKTTCSDLAEAMKETSLGAEMMAAL